MNGTASAIHNYLSSLFLLSESSQEIQHDIRYEEAIHQPISYHPTKRSAVLERHSVRESKGCVYKQQSNYHVPSSSELSLWVDHLNELRPTLDSFIIFS